MIDAKQEFTNLLESTATDLGADLSTSKAELAAFMAERSAHLATIVHEPGFDRAVRREAQAVALRAGLEASDVARATDQRWFDVIATGLRIVAVALA